MKLILSVAIAVTIHLALVGCQTTKATTKGATTKGTTKATTKGATTTAKPANATSNSTAFQNYQKKFAKNYASPAMKSAAQTTYEARIKAIQEHNKKNSSYKQGENQMTDQTYEQAVKTRCGFNGSQHLQDEKKKREQNSGNITFKTSSRGVVKLNASKLKYEASKAKSAPNYKKDVAATLDFRPKLPPIKNQQSCGSCWSKKKIEF